MRDDPDLPGAKGTCLWFSDVLSSPGEFRQEYLFFGQCYVRSQMELKIFQG